jgi:NitT/TauT family transport system substrate-binding protein
MKKKGILILVLTAFIATLLSGCSKDGDLIKVQVNEVAHSIFYAPQYAALELGYFEEEGLDVTLVNGLGADKTMTAVLSGEADIGFMGPEASIYVYNEGSEDYVVNFAQLTQRAGNFLVARDQSGEFKWDNVKGKTVIGGRAGGMPQMVFEYILKKNGLDPKSDLTIIQNIDFGLTAQAFAAGTGDYTIEFEPAATALEKEGTGGVVASLGIESGKVPYTAYAAKKSYIEANPEVIQKLTNAVQKGLDYVNTHTPEEIAKVIAPQFKETEMETLTKIVARYHDQESWKNDTVFLEESFTLLQDILEEAGELSERAPYADLVNTEFATKAAE